eukprot:991982-Ditylum_brightwellii.AAC.1
MVWVERKLFTAALSPVYRRSAVGGFPICKDRPPTLSGTIHHRSLHISIKEKGLGLHMFLGKEDSERFRQSSQKGCTTI